MTPTNNNDIDQPTVPIKRAELLGPVGSELALASLPLIFFLFFYDQLPNRLATHFSAENIPDGWMLKSDFASDLPLLSFYIIFILKIIRIGTILLLNRKSLSDRNRNIPSSIIAPMMTTIELCCISIMLPISIGVIAYNLSENTVFLEKMEKLVFIGISIMIIGLGNLCPKITRRNPFIGIRTPYALSSDEAWGIMQRIGGKFLVMVGILNLIVTLSPLLDTPTELTLFNVGTIVAASLILLFLKPGKISHQ